MSSFKKMFTMDPQLAADGVDIDFGEGVGVTVRPFNNKEAVAYRDRLMQPYSRLRKVPEDVTTDITNKVIARHVLIGWKGVTDLEGNPLEYSFENALKVLSTPEFAPFRDDVVLAAATRETFQREQDEEAAGN